MTRIPALCLLLAAVLAGPVAAAQTVLVELFASQNCRACPKAHDTLRTVSEADPDVLVLTWSVDYWDYLGEDDPMAMGESKDRQLAYVERFSLRGPYTPQTVYNGVKQCPGNRPAAVRRNIDNVRAAGMPEASIARTPTHLVIRGDAAAAGMLTLVEYLPDSAHDTGMRNPVTRVQALQPFEGGELEIELPACASACAVLLETAEHGIPAALALPVG